MPKKGENIYKRKDGRWEGRYIKDRTLAGKAVYSSVYAPTYRDVKNKLSSARNALPQSQKKSAGNKIANIHQVSDAWLACQKLNIKESTYNKYKNLICSYINPELGDLNLYQLTEERLELFFNWLLLEGGKQKKGLSAKTVIDALSVMRRLLKYANEQGYLLTVSAKKIQIKKTEKELRVLSYTEQYLLSQYLMEHLNEKNLGILLCLFTGLRIGELCALTWEDISLTEKTIHVHKTLQRIQIEAISGPKTQIIISTPKSSCSIRTIPLNDKVAELLDANKKTGYLLTGSESKFAEPRTMQNHFKRVTVQSGIKTANFHALRHSFATRCVELGVDVKSLSEILGHANVNITMNRYVHPSMELKRRNMQRLSELIAVK